MLLLFVLTIGKQADSRDSIVTKIQIMVSQLEADIVEETEQRNVMRDELKVALDVLASKEATHKDTEKNITELEEELALLLQERSSLKDELDRLLADKEALPTTDEEQPIPIPNPQRRQYLTGFNFAGNYVVFMIEASGGMVANTIDEALEMIGVPDEEKRRAVKWRRVIRSVQWIVANLRPPQVYQIMVFNNEAEPLLPLRETEWFDPMDRETTAEVLRALEELTPSGGANMERAFLTLTDMFPTVDSVMLLTDGLPTKSDSIPTGDTTTDRDRERFFRVAVRAAPRQTPINTILYPMSGDPAAPFLFWQLADTSNGALISPSPSWPDI